MKIVYDLPPLFDEMVKVFPHVRDMQRTGMGLIFAFGDSIFNPNRIEVVPFLMVHETVHSQQQGEAPEVWWRRYLDDHEFRLAQEIPAHIAELRCRLRPDMGRPERRWTIKETAVRLSHRLYQYGPLFDEHKVRRILKEAIA